MLNKSTRAAWRTDFSSGKPKSRRNTDVFQGFLAQFRRKRCRQDVRGDLFSASLIPYSFISKTVEKLLGVQDEDDEFEPEEGKPILPQIESFAKSRGIELKPGWKVILSKAFKRTLLGKKQRTIPEKYMKMWVDLFEKFT